MKTSKTIKQTKTTTEAASANKRHNQTPEFFLNGKGKKFYGVLAIDASWNRHFDDMTGGNMFVRQDRITVEATDKLTSNGKIYHIAKTGDVVLGKIFSPTVTKTNLQKLFKQKSVFFNKRVAAVNEDTATGFFAD